MSGSVSACLSFIVLPGGLFVAERIDRAELRGFVGGVNAEDQADDGRNRETQPDSPRLDIGYHAHDWEAATQIAHKDADDSANYGDDEGLDQELAHDAAPRGANRLSDANLAGPFRNRHQHDVH